MRATAALHVSRVALVGLAMALALAVTGREGTAQVSPRTRSELERQIRDRWQERMREELDLTEAQQAALRTVLQEFTLERRQLALDERELRLAVERYMRDLPGAPADELVDQAVQLKEREFALYRREMERLGDILTADQLLRFGVMREELARRIRQLAPRRPGR